MKSVVMTRGPARSWWGQSLPTQLETTERKISKRLTARLYRYALDRLQASGFRSSVTDWKVEVYTIDGDSPVDDRSYCVRWINDMGGYIEVIGILINNGKPNLDHGLSIGEL